MSDLRMKMNFFFFFLLAYSWVYVRIGWVLLVFGQKPAPQTDHRTKSPLSTLQSNKFSALTHTITGSLALSKHFTLYTYNGEKCIVRTCGPTALAMPLSVAEMAESRTLRLFDHVNLNRFLGLSLDGPNLLAVWNFCARGALKDVIMSGSAMVRDVVFIQSAIKEICEGLHFLHNSPLQFHGRLKSSACLKMIGGK